MPLAVGARVDPRGDEVEVGEHAVGDEHLRAVQHVVPAVADGARPDRRDVGAPARLGDGDGAERVPPADRRQVLLLERLAPRPVEVGRRHVRLHAHRHGERRAARAPHLLAEDGGGQEVRAAAPVLFVVLDADEAQPAHARPDGLGDLARLLPLLDVRRHFPVDEGAHRLPEHLVLFREDLHGEHP